MFNVITPSTSWATMQLAERGETFAVFFHATTCGHCHEAREVLNEILGEIPISVYAINVLHDQSLAVQTESDATPTLVLFSDGQPVSKLEGLQDAETYTKFLEEGAGEDGGGDGDT